MSLVRGLLIVILTLLLYVTSSVFGGLSGGSGSDGDGDGDGSNGYVGHNLSDFTQHRQKRGLIFQNGGIAKIVFGPVFPIVLGDAISWRSILSLIVFHCGEFKVPDSPLYPWDKWENIYARSQSNLGQLEPDISREFIYTAIEYFMERSHGIGRTCLLRSICENAQVHHHMDVFGEVLNVILTPGKETLDPVYQEAYQIGSNGADCFRYYGDCPKGSNFFDQFIEES
ncbi:uncharacterized protein LOC131997378 [Stomoxys calcitrans]|uniref:uncharacterized protein LOC131997378 n=1 Tax=Stomoxys calcitrans TaxID=35570 RepID=UPI0027E24108|nr:uncharacterized protein LOC131997378 [Stomoxys calcitrans]